MGLLKHVYDLFKGVALGALVAGIGGGCYTPKIKYEGLRAPAFVEVRVEENAKKLEEMLSDGEITSKEFERIVSYKRDIEKLKELLLAYSNVASEKSLGALEGAIKNIDKEVDAYAKMVNSILSVIANKMTADVKVRFKTPWGVLKRSSLEKYQGTWPVKELKETLGKYPLTPEKTVQCVEEGWYGLLKKKKIQTWERVKANIAYEFLQKHKDYVKNEEAKSVINDYVKRGQIDSTSVGINVHYNDTKLDKDAQNKSLSLIEAFKGKYMPNERKAEKK